jgi:NADH-quinone oxidoreductase subunit I/NADH dehydrogenase (ubiquinone) Fe-S protein 8
MKNIFDFFFLNELFQGMGVTFSHIFKKKVTYRYPYEDTPIFPRSRGIQYIKTDEKGVTRCVGCYLCQKVCPSECIHIVTDCGPNGERLIRKYEIDLSRCIYCGFCEEACPVDAVHMGRNYHTADNTRDNYVINMKVLSENYKKELADAQAKGEQL